MAYGYRNGSDVESDNLMAARELANNRTLLNAAERAARPEAYMSIEQLPRVVVSGLSQATRENANETQRLLNRAAADASDRPVWSFREASMAQRKLDDAKAMAEYQARIANGPQMSAWDGVVRLSPAESYLAKVRGGLDAVRGDNWHFQAAQGVPDAAGIVVGDMAAAKVAGLLSRAATPVQGFLFGERSVLMSNLQTEMRLGLQADLASPTSLAALDGTLLSRGATGRQFVTSDPGVGEIISAIEARAPGAVKQAEIKIFRPDGTPYTDFDIVTDTHVIQVKVGGGKGIVPQIQTSQKLTDLPVIGFDANGIVGSGQSFKPSVLKSAQQNGITIVNNVDDLMKVLRPGGY